MITRMRMRMRRRRDKFLMMAFCSNGCYFCNVNEKVLDKMNEQYKMMIEGMSSIKNIHKDDLDFRKRPELTKYANTIPENDALYITIKYLCAEYPNMVNLYRIRKSETLERLYSHASN